MKMAGEKKEGRSAGACVERANRGRGQVLRMKVLWTCECSVCIGAEKCVQVANR